MLVIRKHRILLIAFFAIALIVTFRGGTRDTYNYKYVFEHLEYLNLSSISDFYLESGMEIGYGYLSYILSFFINDYKIAFFIISFTILYSIYKISITLKINTFIFFLVYIFSYYFFMQQFMQIRQGFATALVFLGALLFFNKKYFLSILLFLIACFFHQSTFAFIAFFLAYNIVVPFFEKYKKNILLYIVVISSVAIVCKSVLLIIPNYFIRLASYAGSDYSEVLSPFRLTSLRFYFLFLFFLFFYSKYFKSNINDENSKLINSFLLFSLISYAVGLGVRIGFNDFAILSTRLSEFFLFSEIFLIAFIFSKKSNDLRYMLLLVIYLIFQIIIVINQFDYVFSDYFKVIRYVG
ncbi:MULTISPECIES: EpsG family protein [Acinetobacter]|uniref:EpsG family protein n=1 Tax=Acinetobacter guillouiae NIPH 991 TaxID=1217656 RepID=N8Y6G2_ACIGI|nr:MULTISPECIES: EpsG family protein [Acinetobacter]ENV14910.1 hypothetical protein F964_04497 [Acinetobacter guillouiae NIPH 991]MCG7218886.1 EpsG family protein [Acinetobacter sp. AG3]